MDAVALVLLELKKTDATSRFDIDSDSFLFTVAEYTLRVPKKYALENSVEKIIRYRNRDLTVQAWADFTGGYH